MRNDFVRKGLILGIIGILIGVSTFPLIEYVRADGPGYEVAIGNLSSLQADYTARRIARSSNGDLYAVYFRSDEGYNQIFLKKSSNNGLTWENEEKVQDESSNQQDPLILIDSLGHIIVFWKYSSSTSLYCRMKVDGVWETKELISSSVGMGFYTAVLDANDNIHVLYTIGYDGSCWYRERTNSGWQPEELVAGGSSQRAESITVDNSGIIHAFYVDAAGYYYKLMHRKKIGDAWSSSVMIDKTNNECGPSSCSVAGDNGDVHVVWVYRSGSNRWICYRKYTNNNWEPNIEYIQDSTPYTQSHPTLSVDANNYLYVVWEGKYSGSPDCFQIRIRIYTGNWGPIDSITSASIDQKWPILIWGLYPETIGAKINRPQTGFAFVWNDGPTIRFYKSSDLTWEKVELHITNINLDILNSLSKKAYHSGKLFWSFGQTLDATSEKNWLSYTQHADNYGYFWGECVSSCKALSKDNTLTGEGNPVEQNRWWKGSRVVDGGVSKGTVIATFFGYGDTYSGHAAIFKDYIRDDDTGEIIKIEVWDQNWYTVDNKGVFGIHYIKCKDKQGVINADNYYVVMVLP